MSLPASYLRHQLHWTLPGGEVATTRYHRASDVGTVALTDALVDAVAARALTFWTSQKGAYAAETAFIGSRVQAVKNDGTILETAERFITPVPGTETENGLPTEVAIVASLRTASAGRSARGRMYLPAPTVARITADTRLDHATRDALAADMAAMLANLTVSGIVYSTVVVSEVQALTREVLTVRVGDVFDAQRRRRDALVESYYISNV